MARAVDWVKVLQNYMKKTTKFEQHIRHLKNMTTSHGVCKCELDVTEDHVNAAGHFHMGMTTLLVDVVASYALLAHGNGHSGVSTNIHVSNLKPTFVGDILSIDARVFRISHPLAYMEVELKKKNTDEVVARGQHTMFIVPRIDYKPNLES